MNAEVVTDRVRFAEGPVWCDDGTLVVTSVADGALFRVDPADGAVTRVADTGGGPNGAVPAAGGGFLVAQNGGIDWARTGVFADPPPHRPAPAGLQLVGDGGAVAYVAEGGFHAPNDLVVAADGTVFFTDPPHYPPPEEPVGRVWALRPGGRLEVVADGFSYCNGIGLEPDGGLVVVEGRGLVRVAPDGTREWVTEVLGRGAGDGFCVDAGGRLYVATPAESGVKVLEDGEAVELLALPGDGGLITNCCFGGPGGRDLYATVGLPGLVVVWEGLPTPGLPVHAWPGG